MPKRYSQSLRELLRSMLFQDETRRPTAADILDSPCLQVTPCQRVRSAIPSLILFYAITPRGSWLVLNRSLQYCTGQHFAPLAQWVDLF